MADVEYEGRFKLKVLEWGYKSFDSGAGAISLRCQVVAEYRTGDADYLVRDDGWTYWSDNAFGDMFLSGRWFIFKKEGKPDPDKASSAMEVLGWDGTFSSLAGPCPVELIQGTSQANEYNGKTTYQIGWIYPADANPVKGDIKVNASELAALDAKHGSTFRALRSSLKPAAPSAPMAPAATSPAPQVQSTTSESEWRQTSQGEVADLAPKRPGPVPSPAAKEWDDTPPF